MNTSQMPFLQSNQLLEFSLGQPRFSVSSLPSAPGVYIFLDCSGIPIYIGKSKNLRSRLKSYFALNKYSPPKTGLMVGQAKVLKILPFESEFLALLKEAELIRKFQPKYNVSLKDDKTPDYIVISKNKIIPEVAVVRQNQLGLFKNADIFGPFLSSSSIRTILKIGRKIFAYCDRPNQNGRKRPCFYYHLNLCPGICIGKISQKDYIRQTKKLVLFLRGDHQKLLWQLTFEMKRKSKVSDFEAASKIRDQIKAIESLNTANSFSEFPTPVIPPDSGSMSGMTKISRIEGYDISHLQGKWATASMVVFIEGKPAKEEYRQFRIESFPSSDDPRMLSETLERRFMHPEWQFPDLVMIDGGEPQLRGIFKYFKKLPVKLPKMVGLVKGEEIIILPVNNSFRRINLPKSDPFLKILMAVRDEAHRFARRYHHNLHLKSLISS